MQTIATSMWRVIAFFPILTTISFRYETQLDSADMNLGSLVKRRAPSHQKTDVLLVELTKNMNFYWPLALGEMARASGKFEHC